MMSDKEIEIINGLIEKHKPVRCLEWGAGNSTAYFTGKHSCIKSWLAIDHDLHYINYLRGKVDERVVAVWFPKECGWYYKFAEATKDFYDFILVDGIYREQCLEMALKVAKKGALILLHDSGREEYSAFIKKYNGKKLCDGEVMGKCGFFAHRGLAIFEKL